MKKNFLRAANIMLLTGIFSLVSCLNPLGFSPDFALKLEANVSGEIGTFDITAATGYVVNLSKTIDFTKVAITQKENPKAPDPVSEFMNTRNSKGNWKTVKAKYIQASDIEYEFKITYNDKSDTHPAQDQVMETDLLGTQSRGVYYVYIYKSLDAVTPENPEGVVVISPNDPNRVKPLPVPLPSDTIDVKVDTGSIDLSKIEDALALIASKSTAGYDDSRLRDALAAINSTLNTTYANMDAALAALASNTAARDALVSSSLSQIALALTNQSNMLLSQNGPSSDDEHGLSPSFISPNNKDVLGAFIVMNMTKDKVIDSVQFNHSVTNAIESIIVPVESKNQQSIALKNGQYGVTVRHSGNVNLPALIPHNVQVHAASTPQSFRDNYLYFYKTQDGSYGLTNQWPPSPDDRYNGGNFSPEDLIPDGKGILEITNKSETSRIVKGIRLDNTEYEVTMVRDDSIRFTLPDGNVRVSFKPLGQKYYGIEIPRNIEAKKITRLSYYDTLANPDALPEDEGYGAGLIKLINKSSGLVVNTTIRNRIELSKTMSFSYNDFSPVGMIAYGKTGRIAVVGTDYFPVNNSGTSYLVQISLDTHQGTATVDKLISNIDGEIIEIIINENDIKQEKLTGGNLTVKNHTTTPSSIINVRVVNTANANESAVYGAFSWSPNGPITSPPNKNAVIRVNTSPGLPILEDSRFTAEIAVEGNGNIATISKPVGKLYNQNQSVTINQSDLPPELIFVPVSAISGIPVELLSTIDTSNSANSVFGQLNLNAYALVAPADASIKGPITWTINSGSSHAEFISDGVLKAKATGDSADKLVQLTALIRNAGTGGTDFTANTSITLKYNVVNTAPQSKPVNNISLNLANFRIKTYEKRSLLNIVQFDPPDAHINGVPVSAADITWSLQNGSGEARLSGPNNAIIEGVKAGDLILVALLPAAKNGSGGDQGANARVTVTEGIPSGDRTLQVIRRGGHEKVQSIILIPANKIPGLWLDPTAHDNCGTQHIAGIHHPNTIGQTGHTGHSWANVTNVDISYWKNFQKWMPAGTMTYQLNGNNGLPRSTMGKADKEDAALGTSKEVFTTVTIPAGKYFLFFKEGDDRIRGYVQHNDLGVQFNPAFRYNYFLYLDTDQHYNQNRHNAKGIIPVFYDDWYNTSDIGYIRIKHPHPAK